MGKRLIPVTTTVESAVEALEGFSQDFEIPKEKIALLVIGRGIDTIRTRMEEFRALGYDPLGLNLEDDSVWGKDGEIPELQRSPIVAMVQVTHFVIPTKEEVEVK